jgi:hypothetical protein
MAVWRAARNALPARLGPWRKPVPAWGCKT